MRNLYESILSKAQLTESIFSASKINADTTNKLIQVQIQDICDQMGYKGVQVDYKNESVTITKLSDSGSIYNFDLAKFVSKIRIARIQMINLYLDYEDKYLDIPCVRIFINSDMNFKGLNFIVKPHNGQHNKLFIRAPYKSTKAAVLSNLNIIGGATIVSTHNVRFKHCSISTTSSVSLYDDNGPNMLNTSTGNIDFNIDASEFHITICPNEDIIPGIVDKETKNYVDYTIQDITGGKPGDKRHEYARGHDTIDKLRTFMDNIKDHIDPNFWKRAGINVNSPDINIELSYMGYYGDEFIMLFYNKKPQSSIIGSDIMKTKIGTKVNGIGNIFVGVLVQ